MILALSEQTLNFQLEQLRRRGIAPQSWNVLVRARPNAAPVIKTQTDPDFGAVLERWRSAQARIAGLYTQGNPAAASEALHQAEREGSLWDYGWVGAVGAPVLGVSETSPNTLRLTVPFTSGTLYTTADAAQDLASFDLAAAAPAFTLSVGKVEFTGGVRGGAPQGPGPDHATGFVTDAEFSIESLFMRLAGPGSTAYDPSASTLPPESAAAVQRAFTDYLSRVGPAGAVPFPLPFRRDPAPRPSVALLQPTSIRFSTSPSTDPERTAVNVAMMTGSNELTADPGAGALPGSLLEGSGWDPGDDGVLAVDWSLFQGAVLDPLIEVIRQKVAYGLTTSGYVRTGREWRLQGGTSSTFTQDGNSGVVDESVTSGLVLGSTAAGLELSCAFDYHITLCDSCDTSDTLASLSTTSTYESEPDAKARSGSVSLTIQPGAEGTISISVGALRDARLAFDAAPEDLDEPARTWVSDAAAWVEARLEADMEALASGLREAAASLGSRTILPLGGFYTFRQIRLGTAAGTEDPPVVVSAGYAPFG